ncbi:MAG: hypothetical protein AAGM67_09235 [Bacteroidota bacterium]
MKHREALGGIVASENRENFPQSAKGAENEYLDYLLSSTEHRQPLQSYNEVKPCKAAELDLSDHYAVVGYFRY